MSHIVYLQLSISTSGGTAYHIVKQFENDKDGHAAWHALCEWYNGDAMKTETADTIREKLGSYRMNNGDKIQKNKSEEGLIDVIVVLRKKERSIVQKRKEQRIVHNCQRRLGEEEEEDDGSDNEYVYPSKIKRVKERSYNHIDTSRMVKKGYLSVPDSIWTWDLSEDEKKFFKAVLRDSKTSSGKEEKVLRCKIGFNLGREKEEDETEQEEN
eukprot:1981032-Ditylum_brightwellii.AAC.1